MCSWLLRYHCSCFSWFSIFSLSLRSRRSYFCACERTCAIERVFTTFFAILVHERPKMCMPERNSSCSSSVHFPSRKPCLLTAASSPAAPSAPVLALVSPSSAATREASAAGSSSFSVPATAVSPFFPSSLTRSPRSAAAPFRPAARLATGSSATSSAIPLARRFFPSFSSAAPSASAAAPPTSVPGTLERGGFDSDGATVAASPASLEAVVTAAASSWAVSSSIVCNPAAAAKKVAVCPGAQLTMGQERVGLQYPNTS
mmetsp:Transcript_69614/g.194572  ORF Transcript_69614/g.194572 Transcript_69614/m.194572 type:complete len:259 (-) Transcript_69614:26-802(-)